MTVRKNARSGLFLAALFIAFLVFPITGKAATINVPADYNTIQGAIDAATSGDTVEVAAGTYSPSTNGEVFPINMKDGVSLVGAGAQSTTLDAEQTGANPGGVILCNAIGNSTTIKGFTITGGCASYGCGISLYGSSPAIDACIIRDMGGLSYWDPCWPVAGGGISCRDGSFPCTTNCTITGNKAYYGGGVDAYNYGYDGVLKIANCTISGNVGNWSNTGGGIFLEWTDAEVVNTIVWNNWKSMWGYWYPADISRYGYYGDDSTISLDYCDFNPAYVFMPWSGGNNINADPLFVGGGDYHVQAGSPCINAGTSDEATYLLGCVPCEDADGDTVPGGTGTCSPNIGSDQTPVAGCPSLCVSVENQPPTANAGLNLTITSEEQSATIVQGTASDPESDPLTYRWLEGTTELYSGDVGENGEAYLDLSLLPGFSIGDHTLTLEVSDGQLTATDDMILTVENSAPHAAPTGGGVFEICSDVILGGQVSDYDGDLLSYEWKVGEDVLFFGQIQATNEGDPVNLPNQTLPTHTLGLGEHTITLCVNDGVNLEDVCANILVQVVDTTAPLLEGCIGEPTILWPPNHVMVDCVICAHASDNSGELTLTAVITSDEPIEGLGDGDMAPDWTDPVITPDELCPLGDDPGQGAGVIRFQLRRERSGLEDGREYTITISAVDDSNNESSCDVVIGVPHDQRGKNK